MSNEVMMYTDCSITWTAEDKLFSYRENGPCEIDVWGNVHFSQFTSSSYSRRRGPAMITAKGAVVYKDRLGCYHRTDGPAVINRDGVKQYYVNGRLLSVDEFFLKYGVL